MVDFIAQATYRATIGMGTDNGARLPGPDQGEELSFGSDNRPGGNVTGSYVFTTSRGPNRLELLRELVPKACAKKAPARPEEGCEPGRKVGT
jgi:hypothetical protein